MSIGTPFIALYFRLKIVAYERYLNNLKKRGLRIGSNVIILDNVLFDPDHCFLISVGDNCTICPNVRCIAHDASTKLKLGYTKIGRIVIRENCFIGDSAIILPGVQVGPNSIVGAGSVVTRDVPPETVAAGNPAKVISTLADYLKKIDSLSKDRKIFGEEYHINNLDDAKRCEIIAALKDGPCFIV
jgi:maltose O-acetyltransferase